MLDIPSLKSWPRYCFERLSLPSTLDVMAATNRTIALVTGANQGIGFATAKRLAAEHGYYVIMAGRRLDSIQAAAQVLIEQDLPVEGVVLDVKSDQAIDSVCEYVQR